MGGKTTQADTNQSNDPPRKMDECIREGGLYVKNGRVVDAVGAVIPGWTVDTDGNPVQVDSGK